MKNNFSIVIPVYNECLNINKLINEINENLRGYNNHEIIIVNDCSNDGTEELLNDYKDNHLIKILKNNKRLGQSYSIWHGINHSVYDNILTIDGDGQNNPKDIPNIIKHYFKSRKFSLVGGIRKNRKDNIIKIISSKVANNVRSFILNDDCKDTGCSLKIFDKSIFLNFPYFDGIHRFLPALFKGYGYKCFFINVDDRVRKGGISKYGTFKRLFKGIYDLIKVKRLINKKNISTS